MSGRWTNWGQTGGRAWANKSNEYDLAREVVGPDRGARVGARAADRGRAACFSQILGPSESICQVVGVGSSP